ncbi:cell division protein ZapE [Croceicoccus sp. F390]|uniref:Cell division protein ZapE n=1 Tax=Croceicoccus esteveae TaxID=3075597 RepID=A0ABU2ZHI7_9SPHN|nr:cell division protein ZapE [Croceicoccus sp. F390]MDT0575523.1 cell division protein ZapE [Croceicoccus sp. F390]
MTGLIERYEVLVATGELKPDAEQRQCVVALSRLQNELEQAAPQKRGVLNRLFRTSVSAPPGGIYMWGGVGRGKSMLMDLFHETLAIEAKRRVHFHEFMLEVHERLRQERLRELGDPIQPVAAALASALRCLAFDEMVVNNSADAMIMSRLFTALMDQGVTIVTTSNRPPGDLYKDGLNREHFLPFVELIRQRLEVIALNGPVDYRLQRLGGMDMWHYPLGEEATDKARDAFFRLTDYPPEDADNVSGTDLAVSNGRTIWVPKSLKGVAAFSFKRLCEQPRGAADYLAIARNYHTVIIVGIPQLGPDSRNEAARFVTLIDALYENGVKLIVAAQTAPEQLYKAGDGSFEFERTVSRLNEMQSAEYLALGHGAQ